MNADREEVVKNDMMMPNCVTPIIVGPYIGGNYWATPAGNGFSQTNSDVNGDGISEKPYSLNGVNVDYLPLSKPLKFPVAALSASPTSGNVPLKVQFTDKSTGSSTSWKWSFGDGTSSTVKNPAHTYSKAGKYTSKVQFTDKSTGSPSSWKWSFGDGMYSTAKNPVHTYSKAGKYTVGLTVKNAKCSNTKTVSGYITVK